jgi:hypothetical protein
MQPAYAAGAARSRLIELLAAGHEDVRLSREELDKLVAWIDIGVPYGGDYFEANIWTADELAKHERFTAKRARYDAEDRQNIADWLRHTQGR